MAPEDLVRSMSERILQNAVMELATFLGWRYYHTYDARRSNPGYPDLHLWHPKTGRFLFIELKSSNGAVSKEQNEVLGELADVYGPDHVDVWWPKDYFSGKIEKTLRVR